MVLLLRNHFPYFQIIEIWSQRNIGNAQELSFSTFSETIEKIVKKNFKTSFYKIRVLLKRSKKKKN